MSRGREASATMALRSARWMPGMTFSWAIVAVDRTPQRSVLMAGVCTAQVRPSRPATGCGRRRTVHLVILRRAMAIFLPLAVLVTLCTGLVYVADQQVLRLGANDPQVQLAEDAAHALDGGASAGSLVGAHAIDIASSLAPFVVIFDASGAVLATDGQLDGHDPAPPAGVLERARTNGSNRVTWQPRPGVRVATVTVAWHGGTVMAGRSLREAERREDALLLVAAAAWLAMMAALAVAAFVAARLWASTARGVDGSRDGRPER
jgi:hypothetical protein